MMVATEVRPSGIKGKGLYSVDFIPSGCLVFRWVDGYDREYTSEYPSSLSPIESQEFKKMSSYDGESWYLAGGNGAYFNHSTSPNIRVVMGRGSPSTWDRVAVRDIEPGEELTMDYREIGIDPI